jgi:hypothetical protein
MRIQRLFVVAAALGGLVLLAGGCASERLFVLRPAPQLESGLAVRELALGAEASIPVLEADLDLSTLLLGDLTRVRLRAPGNNVVKFSRARLVREDGPPCGVGAHLMTLLIDGAARWDATVLVAPGGSFDLLFPSAGDDGQPPRFVDLELQEETSRRCVRLPLADGAREITSVAASPFQVPFLGWSFDTMDGEQALSAAFGGGVWAGQARLVLQLTGRFRPTAVAETGVLASVGAAPYLGRGLSLGVTLGYAFASGEIVPGDSDDPNDANWAEEATLSGPRLSFALLGLGTRVRGVRPPNIWHALAPELFVAWQRYQLEAGGRHPVTGAPRDASGHRLVLGLGLAAW